MPVIGMKFSSISAEKKDVPASGEIKVNSTPRITSVKDINLMTLNKKALALNFEFITNYTPEIGNIKIGGEILYVSDKNAQILKQWKSKKTMPEFVNVEILNHLFRHCLLKVANIADDLQLPPPIAMPRVRPKQKEPGYVG